MKNTGLLIIVFALLSTTIYGQSAKQKRAERQFNTFSFVKAIGTYEKMIDTSYDKQSAMRKLGDAYIMLRQPEKAVAIYKRVVKQENVPSEYYLYYAQALRATGAYEESKEWMKKYREAGNKQDSRVKSFFKDGDMASAIFNSKEQNTIHKQKFNTAFNDFGAVVLNDSIYFASSRDEGVSIKRLYAWDEQPMMDMYKTSIESGSVEGTVEVSGDVNTIEHDGPASFNAEGTKMYFSRNNYFENKKIEDQKGIMHLGIYSADKVGSNWENVKSLSINNSEYSVYHPSLSKDGKKLYYTSDMANGYGGTDIYVSTINADGSIGAPENLGEIVNSEGNETFPFVHGDDQTLYFSSDGHVGLGLMDVFVSVKGEEGTIVNVINLGDPINSKKDDIAYYLSEDGFKGYISSNRKGGVGGDDIYSFTRIPPLTLKGQIFDAINNAPIAGAKITLERKNGEELASFVTESDGSYEHVIDRDEDFVLRGSKEKYDPIEKGFNSFGLEKEVELVVDLNIGLTPIEDVVLLADLETIYFDLDKDFIRPDASLELDKVVNLMVNTYPGMVIRLESHTDSRARDEYNIDLSNRRAKSTYDYLVSNGVDASRITEYRGFGETQLVNKCSNKVKCSEEEHQLNRRTEFVIIKMK